MKLMKTQGASDAMQMAHYKLTIIIIIIITYVAVVVICKSFWKEGFFLFMKK